MTDININRVVRSAPVAIARYIEPPHAVLVGPTGITPQDTTVTAICWLVGRRPSFLMEHKPTLKEDEHEALTRALASPRSDQLLIFAGMGGLMTVAKEIFKGTRTNEEYLKLRWKALCATAGIPNMWEGPDAYGKEVFDGVVASLMAWQAWIRSQGDLRQKLLDYCLANTEDNILIRGAIEQVKMILKDYGLKAALLMEAFITAGSKAIFLSAIAQQAVDLKRALSDLRALHGDRFPYMRVYPLEGVDRINHRTYPDLYYAAVKHSLDNKELGQEGRFIMSEVQTTIPKTLIDEHLPRRYRLITALDDVTKENLRTLGIDPEAARRGGREDEEEILYPRRR